MPRPWISCNLAISADGKITSTQKCPSTWTSREDHTRLLELRRAADALIVGRGTLEADGMTMTVSHQPKQPLRCIVSRSGELSANHPIFHRAGGDIHILATESLPSPPNLPATYHHRDLASFLQTLATELTIQHLHCEGGGGLIRSLAALDVIDEIHVTLAGHTLFGGHLATTMTGIPAEYFPSARNYEISHFEPRPDLGECFLSYRRQRNP